VLGAATSACRATARASRQCRKRLSLGLTCAFFGCQQPLVVGESRVTPAGSKGTDSSQTLDEHCPDVALLRAADDACWPTAHVGRWHGFVTGDARYYVALSGPFSYPSGDVRLNVDPAGSGTLIFAPPEGFGSGAVDAGLDAAPLDVAATLPAAGGLMEGFTYALVGLSMSGSPSASRRLDRSMQFSVSLSQPQETAPSGRSQSPSACDACGPAPDTLSGALLLSADGAALRGTLSSLGPEGPLAAGLELIRE
jgi:hypothetical protein